MLSTSGRENEETNENGEIVIEWKTFALNFLHLQSSSHLESPALDHPDISRDPVAELDLHDVSKGQLLKEANIYNLFQ